MKIQFLAILSSLMVVTEISGQTSEKTMETAVENAPLNARYMAEYLMWGDERIVAILEKLTEEEFTKPFNELSGNIYSKTAHIQYL